MSIGFTAREAGVDAQAYFEDIILNFNDNESAEDWLPWNWKKRKRIQAQEEQKVA